MSTTTILLIGGAGVVVLYLVLSAKRNAALAAGQQPPPGPFDAILKGLGGLFGGASSGSGTFPVGVTSTPLGGDLSLDWGNVGGFPFPIGIGTGNADMGDYTINPATGKPDPTYHEGSGPAYVPTVHPPGWTLNPSTHQWEPPLDPRAYRPPPGAQTPTTAPPRSTTPVVGLPPAPRPVTGINWTDR